MAEEQPQLNLPLKSKLRKRVEFHAPLIVVCEGLSDREFFRKLLSVRSIGSFEVPFPHDPSVEKDIEEEELITGGKSRFPDMLRAIKFSEVTKAVLLVLDSADEVKDTFVFGRKCIEEAEGYNLPDAVMALAPANGDIPAIAIATIPPDAPGGLEIPCYQALIRNREEIAKCIEILCECAGVNTWNPEKQGKARLQCGIATINEADPNKSLRKIFERTTPIIPLADESFSPIETVLRTFAKLAGVST